MSNSLKVLVDGTSPAIQYAGEWVSATPTEDMRNLTLFNGNYPFSNKLFAAPEGKPASLKYSFTGVTRLRLHATIDAPRPAGLGGDTAWENQCDVEPRGPSVATESFTLSSGKENNYVLCDVRNLSPTETYKFTYTVTVESGQPVWFDRLVLDPSANANLENALIQMDHTDLRIRYDKDWSSENNIAHSTRTPQSKMSVNFTGTSVSWYDVWREPWGMRGADASWTIDDKPFQMFVIPTIDAKYTDLVVQDLLFKTPDLEPGPHRLEVTYAAEFDSNSVRPLALKHLVIQNAPVPTGVTTLPSPSPTPSTTDTSTGSVSVDSSSGLSQGAKIGVGVGVSVAGLVILGLIALLLTRRRKAASPKVNTPVSLERSDSSPSEKKA